MDESDQAFDDWLQELALRVTLYGMAIERGGDTRPMLHALGSVMDHARDCPRRQCE